MYHETNLSPPVNILLTIPRQCFFYESFLLFMFRVCHAVLSVHCSLVINCWERTNLLALLYVIFSCVFVTFPCGVLGQVWCLIVSIHDICLLPYLDDKDTNILLRMCVYLTEFETVFRGLIFWRLLTLPPIAPNKNTLQNISVLKYIFHV